LHNDQANEMTNGAVKRNRITAVEHEDTHNNDDKHRTDDNNYHQDTIEMDDTELSTR